MKLKLIVALVIALFACSAKASDLYRQFDDKHITEILVSEGAVHSLRVESARAISLGLATIFVSPNGGKLSFHSALALADELSYKGWHVDVISASWFSIPIQESASSQAAMSEKSMKVTASQPWMSSLQPSLNLEGLSQHLKVIMNALDANNESINGFRLVIAEGIAAALILNLNDSTANADAVTLIAPFWPDTEVNQALAEKAAAFGLPILDLDFASSNRFAHSTSALRAKKARVGIKLNYRQRLFPIAQRHNTIDWIGGEIVGWTRSLGW